MDGLVSRSLQGFVWSYGCFRVGRFVRNADGCLGGTGVLMSVGMSIGFGCLVSCVWDCDLSGKRHGALCICLGPP